MPLLADRVRETSATTGTGTMTLAGAVAGYQGFNAAFANGATVYYVIHYATEWEVGIGTVGTGTLARNTVLQSSNGDALVPFSAGTKDVFCAYVAERAVTTSDAATLTNKTIDDYTNNIGANSTHFRVKASGSLPKGTVVKASGFTPGEQAITVVPVASASDIAIGVMEQALTSGQFGMAVVIGELFDVNTNAFAFNDVLYSNGAGGLTATKPASGLYQSIGTVVRVNTNNGVIAVNIVAPMYVEATTNTANTSVLRDGSGNFAAGTVTAALSGNASTATALATARNINGVSFNGTSDITVTAAAGTLSGATLAANVLASSLTSVGTLANLTVTNPITGSVTGSSGSTMGNAATATALATARTINGVSFNGTANITVTAAAGTLTGTTLAAGVTASSLTSVGTLASLTVTAPISGSVTGSSGSTTGNAATATALATARNINGVSFNGTADITVTAAAGTLSGSTLASGVTASSLTSVGTLTALTVAAKVSANSVGTITSGFYDGLSISGYDAIGWSGSNILAIGGYRSSQWIGIDFYTAGVSRAIMDSNGNLAVDTNTLFVDAANNAVGVGTLTPQSGGASSRFRVRQATDNAFTGIGIEAAGSGSELLYLANTGTRAVIGQTFLGGGGAYQPICIDVGGSIRATFDTPGNFGLGVTPSAWGSNWKAFDQTAVGALAASAAGSGDYGPAYNAYNDNTNWLYKYSGPSARYRLNESGHSWFTAPSGTAGNAISFVQDMTLTGGNLLVGPTSGIGGAKVAASGTFLSTTNTLSTFSGAYGGFDWTSRSLRLFAGTADATGSQIEFYAGVSGAINVKARIDNTATAGHTALLLWDVDNATLERVTVGAADSGGVGFKVLRIPN